MALAADRARQGLMAVADAEQGLARVDRAPDKRVEALDPRRLFFNRSLGARDDDAIESERVTGQVIVRRPADPDRGAMGQPRHRAELARAQLSGSILLSTIRICMNLYPAFEKVRVLEEHAVSRVHGDNKSGKPVQKASFDEIRLNELAKRLDQQLGEAPGASRGAQAPAIRDARSADW